MANTTVRLSEGASETLRELARGGGKSMQAVLEQAIEALRRQHFLEAVNSSYGTIRNDAPGWAEIEEERRAWDATLLDGLSVREGRATYRRRKSSARRKRK